MIKSIARRFTVMLLAVMMVFTMMPTLGLTAPVHAATTLTGLSDEGIGLSYNGGTWTASGTEINGSATGKGGCGGSSEKATLTITNNKGIDADLSFNYDATLNGGTIKIDGTDVKDGTNVSWNKTLKAGASVSISLESDADAKTTSIKFANVALSADVDAKITFKPAAGGTYTVDGTAITKETTLTKNAKTGVSVKATAANGYKFLGWYSETEGTYLSTAASATLHIEKAQIIVPRFAAKTAAVFETAGAPFTDLNEAVKYAQSKKADKITLVSDGTITGNYTIPKGITLLIPFDKNGTCYTNEPANVSNNYTVPSKFRELTMASGSSLTVEGALSLSAKHGAAPGSGDFGGSPSGPCSYIKMEKGSNITLNEGGQAYVWGFIYGDGAVTAKSGSLVYENMQITDFRGGNATSRIVNTKCFPFNQYYVQNIEVAETLEYGANEFVYSSLYAVGSAYSTEVHFVGSNGAMFVLSPGASLVKKYVPSTDRLELTVNGEFSIQPLSLEVGPASVNSANYNLPITNNITVNINSGKTTINQDLALLPGVEVNIAPKAELNVSSGHNVFVYDASEWNGKKFAGNSGDYVRQRYTASSRAARPALVDAKIDVNGTLSANGSIYTTASGADIRSSKGTGKYVLNAAPGTAKTTVQMSGVSGSTTNINVTAAKLHNGSQYAGTADEFTATAGSAAGDFFGYNKKSDKWEKGYEPKSSVVVTFDANEGKGTMEDQTMDADTETVLTKNAFTREGYVFDHWNTKADGSGTSYTGAQSVTLKEDTTLYAIWKVNEYTITWKDADGTVLKTDKVAYGETPKFEGDEPTKKADAQYTYKFKGWTPEVTKVTGDATYTAEYTQTVNKYDVTWKNEDGTVLKTDSVAYGTTPEYKGEIPTKKADEKNSYVFDGWTPKVSAVTGDATYTAKFKAVINTYTVTWTDEDGTELEKDENVPYGTKPTFDGKEPTKKADAQYTYTFSGWTPEVSEVTGDVTYKAVYKATVNKYTVTWKDADGNVLEEDKDVPYGTKPSYDGETPTKTGTAEKSYTFTGWDPAIGDATVVTGDVTYTAQFAEMTNTYTVIWADEDGTELEKDEDVPYGTEPKFDGTEPTKKADAQYTYKFAGWTPSVDKVTGDVTYTATYSQTVNKYTITWKNADGTELKSEKVAYGDMPAYSGETPTKAATEENSYTFAGWDPEVEKVTEDAVYTAKFTAEKNKYTVTWKNADGTTLETDEGVTYGATPKYDGKTPEKEKTAEYTYTFAGWTPEVSTVSGDVTYTAKFTETKNVYTIKWKDEDGNVLDQQELEYGATPEYDGAEPAKAADAQYTYTFKGWSPAVAKVTGDADYTATFDKKVNTYTVRWVGEDGTVLETDENVAYGEMPEYNGKEPVKEATSQYTYTFKGWDPEVKEVTGDVTYQAVFEKKLNKYTVTWKDEDGTVLEKDENVEYGAKASYDGSEPTKKEDAQYTYKFSGWTPSDLTVTGDMTFQAVYQGTVKTYDVTWYDEDGTVLEKYTDVAYGVTPTYDGKTPTKADTDYVKYTFKGWDPEVLPVTGEASYRAVYEAKGKTVWVKEKAGKTYIKDGAKAYFDTWAEIDGDQYYFDKDGYVVTGIYETKAADGSHTAQFIFAKETGRFMEEQNGLYKDGEDTYWSKDGEIVKYAGLQKVGDEYYYFDETNKAVKDGDYDVVKTNGMNLPACKYHFLENGVIEHDQDTSKTGIKASDENDGRLYYFIDGVKVRLGLIKIGDDYYYAKTSTAEVVRDRSYWITKTNGFDIEEGSYEFDKDGKMILPDKTKNGIVKEDGSLYYYVDGKRTYAGLIEIDGSYYYVRSNGEVVHDTSYWPTKTNDLMKTKKYDFDSDGKMILPDITKNGIVSENGSLYYYKDGEISRAGLIEVGGSYYYVRTSNGEIIHGRRYWVSQTNGLPIKEGEYQFADDGKLIIPEPTAQKNGIVEENGGLYYYKDGQLDYAGLISIDGDYYYVRSNGQVVQSRRYWITKHNNLLPEGEYEFDASGKLVK